MHPYLLLTAAETRAVEAAAMKAGVPGAAMMENAGRVVAEFIMRNSPPRPTAILCGPGNNGGDGFVVARRLKEAGVAVRVGLLGERAALKGDAALMASLFDGAVEPLAPDLLEGAGLIVDALFGTGLRRPPDGAAQETIRAANAHAAPIYAIDIPSGVDADTGAVLGLAAEAAATITFVAKKPGHLLFPGRALTGAVTLADIGIPTDAYASVRSNVFENSPLWWGDEWRRPDWTTHKYHRGHAVVVSGPRLRTGAARLAAIGALRAGAGLVTMLTSPEAAAENAAHLTSVMLREGADAASISAALHDRRITVALIGPGAGVSLGTKESVMTILRSAVPAVLDADALTSFEGNPAALFAHLGADDVLTPHEGEFGRLFLDLKDLPGGRLAAAREAANASGAVIVLKGPDTIIAGAGGRAAINANAPFDLATAGAGDVLAGFIAGLRAGGMPAFEAAAAGVWLHGACGEAAGPGLIAEDLPDALPRIMASILAPPREQSA